MLIVKKEYIGTTVSSPRLGSVVVDSINLKAAKYYAKNGLSHIFEVKPVVNKKAPKGTKKNNKK